jgi:tetratricopeptide (TPR) repeat protein
MFEQVIEMDPAFAGGYAGLAAMLGFGSLFAHGDCSAAIDRAVDLARKAIAVDETFGWAYTALALALMQQGEYDDAIAASQQAIERQPSDADARAYRAIVLGISGRPGEAIECVDEAIRLNPRFVNGPYLNIRAQVSMIAADYEAAVQSLKRNIRRQGPVGVPALCTGAASYWALGRTEEAHAMVQRLASQFPEFRLGTWNFLTIPRDPDVRERVTELMRAAGVPD